MNKKKLVLGFVILVILVIVSVIGLNYRSNIQPSKIIYVEITAHDKDSTKYSDQYKQNFTSFEFEKVDIVDYEKPHTISVDLAYKLQVVGANATVLEEKKVGFSTEVIYTTCASDASKPCKDVIYGELKTSLKYNSDAHKIQLYKDDKLLTEILLEHVK